MTNVTALVQSASIPNHDLGELWDIYKGFVSRGKNEHKQMKRALSYVKDESLLDIQSLFSLPEAWKDNLPTIALAPMHFPNVGYRSWSSGIGFFFDPQKISVPDNSFLQFPAPITFKEAKAIVPPVPKSVAPWNPLTRRKCFVLFDADWKVLPADPYLLERINVNQFRIVGHWDISDKERQLMALLGKLIV